jgi:hypothetical protein
MEKLNRKTKQTYKFLFDCLFVGLFDGRDRMVVGFTTTYAISANHHWCCEFESRSGGSVQHYVIKFVSDLQQEYKISDISHSIMCKWSWLLNRIYLRHQQYKFWMRGIQWTFLQSLVPIVGVVSQKKINRSHELKIWIST